MHPSTARTIGLFSEDVYQSVFRSLDADSEFSGDEAGFVACLAQLATRVGILIAFGETEEARHELTRLVERAERFASDQDDAMAEVMGRSEQPELIP